MGYPIPARDFSDRERLSGVRRLRAAGLGAVSFKLRPAADDSSLGDVLGRLHSGTGSRNASVTWNRLLRIQDWRDTFDYPPPRTGFQSLGPTTGMGFLASMCQPRTYGESGAVATLHSDDIRAADVVY